MEIEFSHSNSLITGGSRGIGEAIARELVRHGARVALVARSENDLRATVNRLPKNADEHFYVVSNLLEEGEPERIVREVKSRFGSIDIVVHNIGGSLGVHDPLCSREDWQKLWKFNLGIAIEINRCVIPAMQEKGWGRLVHISSVDSNILTFSLPYGTIKAALERYVWNLGRMMAEDGVVVTAVKPSATRSGPWAGNTREKQEEIEKFLQERMPINRLIEPEEIAKMVTLLSSDDAVPFAGSVIPMVGGDH